MACNPEKLSESLSKVQGSVAEKLVPWFAQNMPASYFTNVPDESQVNHMRALSAQFDPIRGEFSQSAGSVTLRSETPDGGYEVTFMDFGGKRSTLLAGQLDDLMSTPNVGVLAHVNVYTSKDDKLSFDMYTFSPQTTSGGGAITDSLRSYVASLKEAHDKGVAHKDPGIAWSPLFEEEKLAAYAAKCDSSYITHTGPRSFLKQYELYAKVDGTEDVAMYAEPSDLVLSPEGVNGRGEPCIEGGYWLRMALTNSIPLSALRKIVKLLMQRRITVERMHLDLIASAPLKGNKSSHNVCMMRMFLRAPQNAKADWLETLQPEVKRVKWLDDFTIKLAFRNVQITSDAEEIGIQRGEIITCLSSMLFSMLPAQNMYAFSKTNINNVVENSRFLRLSTMIANIFATRFNPKIKQNDEEFKTSIASMRSEIERDVQEDAVAREVLHRMLTTVEHTFRTNLFLEDRYALAIRIDTRLFVPGSFDNRYDATCPLPEMTKNTTPFGVFYVHGRRFNAFHVRFRDIARGGMRLVSPQTAEQLAIEASRQYSEAYNLAFAQQAKNKDIPEGGSKCVVLVDCCSLPPFASGPEGKNLVLRKSVKAFTDSMLDLIVDTPITREFVRDFYGKQELVYLGPDEQVIADDINWIVGRAAQRGYPIPAAFMSSKPDAGINHKEFGVTSEGVQVFLDVALREMGMHPSQNDGKPFTVKITGGPDGDVAGNMIRILNREYGKAHKVVGICDATGCAEDPNGLDNDELMRLFREGSPIFKFDASKLSSHPDAALHICDASFHGDDLAAQEKALRARNTMHNRVKSDCFVPAGGRPNTIHEGNWRAFLDPETGKPSSQLIVEGANLFITPGARDLMHKATGIPIVKDSSANKCGVICSSFEIMSSMLLSEQEFHDIKPELVKDVLVRLRLLAKREAELLFREFRTLPGSLPDFSRRQSEAINRVTDAIAAGLDERTGGDYSKYMYLVEEHMPEKLTQVAGDRLLTRVPKEYIKRVISSALASKMVYQEGSPFVEPHTDEHLAKLSFEYLLAEQKIRKVEQALDKLNWEGDLESQKLTKQIVREGGVKSMLVNLGSAADN